MNIVESGETTENDSMIYNEFMQNLTPCSSNLTINDIYDDNDVKVYSPIEFNNLLMERNVLNKTGTLIDDGKVDKFQIEHIDDISLEPCQEPSLESLYRQEKLRSNLVHTIVPEHSIKLMIIDNNGDNNTSQIINLFSVISFIQDYTHHEVNLDTLTVNHLMIFIMHQLNLNIWNIKLCHLGKIYKINNIANVKVKQYLVSGLKIDKFPTIQLIKLNDHNNNDNHNHTNNENIDPKLCNVSINKLITYLFEPDICHVTYADAIIHKIKVSKQKSQFKVKLKRLLKV